VLRWASENLLQLKPEEIGEHYGRYRLHVPEAERAMAKSLERYGQLSPVVVLSLIHISLGSRRSFSEEWAGCAGELSGSPPGFPPPPLHPNRSRR